MIEVQIKQQLVEVKKRYCGEGVNRRQYLTFHQTDNFGHGAGAQAHANLQSGGYKLASWHWQVDDKLAVQSYPEDVVCWHAGDGGWGTGNIASIGVEMCVNPDSDYSTALSNAAVLVAQIMKRNSIPLSNLVQHNHWTGKNCPSQIRARGEWDKFRDMVSKNLGGSSSGGSTVGNIVRIDGEPVAAGTASAFYRLAAAFKSATGYSLHVTSGYRSTEEQRRLYNAWLNGTFSAPSVAPPGTSLHESGRALDIRDSGDSAGVTIAGNARSNWIRNNARTYGFDPAGYGFGEPWHIEYMGDPWSGSGGGGGSQYNENGYDSGYVKTVQQLLIAKGYSVGPDGADGELGKNTFDAVKRFQKANGLTQDGIPGPATLAKLKASGGGSQYNENNYDSGYVKTIQQLLMRAAYSVGADGADGVLGKNTFDAVKKFQADKGLAVDGIPGPDTLAKLKSASGGSSGASASSSSGSKVKKVQAAVRADQDGIVGPDTRKRVDAVRKASNWGGRKFPYGVAYTQGVVGTTADGVWGDNSESAHDRTVIAIQKAVGASVDGVWGSQTEGLVKALGA